MGQQSDRVDLGAKRPPAAADRPTDEKPANRETVLVRVNAAAADGASGPRANPASGSAFRVVPAEAAATAATQASGPRPAVPTVTAASAPLAPREQTKPPRREQTNPPRGRDASGARPAVPPPAGSPREQTHPPRREAPRPEAANATAVVRDPGPNTNVAELPLPASGGGYRLVIAAVAVLAGIAALGILVVPKLLSGGGGGAPTPFVIASPPATPTAVVALPSPIETTTAEPAGSPRSTPTSTAAKTPRPTVTALVVAPTPTPTRVVVAPTPTPTKVAVVTPAPTPTIEVGMGTLTVVVRPWVTLFIDGDRKGQGPRVSVPVKAGSHTLELHSAKGYKHEMSIRVRAGKTCELQMNLEQDPDAVPQAPPGCS
jgi:hypothetical protein